MILRLLRSSFKRFKVAILVNFFWFFVATIYILFTSSSDINKEKQLIAVQTGFYYNISTFYPDNTVVLIFFSNYKLNPTGWVCATSNEATTMNSGAFARAATTLNEICKWTTYIIVCPSVVNPTKFQLTVNNRPSNITIPLELPNRKRRGIVSCYAPMFYEQRWQVISMIHELNAGFGVDLQVHYVQSVVGETLRLLNPMVKLGLLEFRGLDIPDFGKELTRKLGYNPAQATEARHQVMALQDCYFRYRESAEFIMVSDPDDLFIPLHGKNLYAEFSHWKRMNPMASAWMYSRNISTITTASKIKNFSIAKTLRTLQLTKVQDIGKSIHNPKYAETPWIHWPGIKRTEVFNVPPSESYAIHLQYKYDKSDVEVETTTNIAKVIDTSIFANHSVIDYNKAQNTIADLPEPSLDYAKFITICRNRIHALYQIPMLMTYPKPCTTVTSCRIPKRNVTCNIAVRSYQTKCTQGDYICAIMPDKVLPDFVKRSDGCAWGISSSSVNINI